MFDYAYPSTVDTINGAITNTPERMNTFAFTTPLYRTSYSAIYKIPSDSSIKFMSITANINITVYALFMALFILLVLVYGIAHMYKLCFLNRNTLSAWF
jgi:hypothetical protein